LPSEPASIDAPPPAEPPSPQEIEAAEIPEPPAASERALDDGTTDAGDEANPAEALAAEADSVEPVIPATHDVGTPEAIEAPAVSLPLEPVSEVGTPEAIEAPAVSVPLEPISEVGTPEAIESDDEPSISPFTPTVSPVEDTTASVPPRAAQAEWSTPVKAEPAGALALIKGREMAIAMAAAVAALLFLIIRKLR